MTENEADVLDALIKGRSIDVGGLKPREFGGEANSHHGTTASRMVAKGWTEERYEGQAFGENRPRDARYRSRGKYYRVTERGGQALAAHRLSKSLA